MNSRLGASESSWGRSASATEAPRMLTRKKIKNKKICRSGIPNFPTILSCNSGWKEDFGVHSQGPWKAVLEDTRYKIVPPPYMKKKIHLQKKRIDFPLTRKCLFATVTS